MPWPRKTAITMAAIAAAAGLGLLVTSPFRDQKSYRPEVERYLRAIEERDPNLVAGSVCADSPFAERRQAAAGLRAIERDLGGPLSAFDILRGAPHTSYIDVRTRGAGYVTRSVPLADRTGRLLPCPKGALLQR